MRRIVFVTFVMVTARAFSWGPATHVYLAERATGSNRPETHFGSMLVDMNHFVRDEPEVVSAVRRLTHYESDRIAPSCLGLGMITHNEAWGADWYSHQYWMPDTTESAGLYSTEKIRHLEQALGVAPAQAEFAIEYLLRVDTGPALGRKMLAGAAAFGPGQQQLLVDAFAPPLAERVAGLSHGEAEEELCRAANLFRFVTEVYGGAFVRDETAVFDALSSLTAFYLRLEPDTAARHLAYAVELCRDDYRAELDRIGELLRADMAAYAPEAMEACSSWGCSAPRNGTAQAALDPLAGVSLALGAVWACGSRRRGGKGRR